MVCTKSPIGWRRRTAAFCVARAVARGNLVILASWVLRSTRVSKPPLCPALTTVSPSQSPRRVLRGQWPDARKCRFYRDGCVVVLACTLVITFSAPPKTAPQVAAVAFVIPDHLVDAFMAQLDACSLSQPLICSGDQRIWRNFASILLRVGTVSLRGLLRIACRA